MSARRHRIEDRRWFGDTATSITFHRMEEDDRFIQRVVAAAKNLDIFEGSPGRVLEIEDAFAMPGIPFIWISTGSGSMKTAFAAAHGSPNMYGIPGLETRLSSPPEEYDTVEEPMVYLSFLPN